MNNNTFSLRPNVIWKKRDFCQSTTEHLSQRLGISLRFAQLLAARGMSTIEEAQAYLCPKLSDIHDPNVFRCMPEVVERIIDAIKNHETIGLFGDYDVDGVCSLSLLSDFLTALQATFVATLPNRMLEGYGLSIAGVKRLHQEGATLLITVDCGVTAHEQIVFARTLGLDVIVIDHHHIAGELPEAIAIINPHRLDCGSKATYMCAAAISFYVCIALRRRLRERGFFHHRLEPDLRHLLDLVALATICDVVPLIQDNRVLVHHGLSALRLGKRPGLQALLFLAKQNARVLSSSSIGFHIGPRLNAAGRLEDAMASVQLLRTSSKGEAMRLAEQLETQNQARRALEKNILEEAVAEIRSSQVFLAMPILVLGRETWHPGVVGIVASRLVELFHKPTIVIGEQGKGSGRSIPGFHLYEAVYQVRETLKNFGGHAHAIGVSLHENGLDRFRDAVVSHVSLQGKNQMSAKEISYDQELKACDVDFGFYEELEKATPFGRSNPEPVFRFNQVYLRDVIALQGGHIKGTLEQEGKCRFIGFRMEFAPELKDKPVDVLASIECNHWQGKKELQLRLLDYKS